MIPWEKLMTPETPKTRLNPIATAAYTRPNAIPFKKRDRTKISIRESFLRRQSHG